MKVRAFGWFAFLVCPLATRAGAAAVFTLTGHPIYFHRRHVEVEDVSQAEQAIYQSSWVGQLGVRVSGLPDGPCHVRLSYTEMGMDAPRSRVFDILLNGEVVRRQVCIYNAVGNRRVLAFDFDAVARNGIIVYEQRQSVPEAITPSFTRLQIYDALGRLMGETSAYALRPADWERRDYLDEIYLPPPLPDAYGRPPWVGTYRIRPGETARLTAADVVGSDGIVYPNWVQVGIPGGIPALGGTLSAADFGMRPETEADSSSALQQAIDALQARGGGVLVIPAGRYYLDRPVFVTSDGCVLRGAGAERTRLISRFSMLGKKPEFSNVAPASRIGPGTGIIVWADPEGLTDLKLTAGEETVGWIKKPGLWERQIAYGYLGSQILKVAGEGRIRLTITASYRNGPDRSASIDVVLTRGPGSPQRPTAPLGVINFLGRGPETEPHVLLAADGKRGDMTLELEPDHELAPGDRIQIVGPETRRWDVLLRTRVPRAPRSFRMNEYQVVAVHGARIDLTEALRVKFPTEDGSYVVKIRPMVRSGIEDMGLEQAVQTQIHGVLFNYGWECWARGLDIVHAGDKALYMPNSKRCEVRDCVFDRSWCNDGGSAYVGWETSYDCLMDGITAYEMRHAPVLQWASSGNVIRRSIFHGSDMQWHAGWTNENLYEELIVESSQTTGAYGNGAWASGPDDSSHGPNGPRNVVYNCALSGPKTGIWMGGMNEGWIIAYNRFVVGRGPAVVARAASFDHIFAGNIFVMLEPEPAAVYLGTSDCTGIDFIGNRFFGPVKTLFGGYAQPAVDRDNRILPSGGISRLRPAVRSIFEWEMGRRAEILAAMQARQH